MPSDLCMSCNLCCDGSVFSSILLTDADLERLGDRVPFDHVDGEPRILLGCSQLDCNGACRCYAERPSVCRSFHCKLVRRLDAGHVDEATALEIVEDIKQWRDKAVTLMLEALKATGQPVDNTDVLSLFQQLRRARPAFTTPAEEYLWKRSMLAFKIYLRQADLHIVPFPDAQKPHA